MIRSDVENIFQQQFGENHGNDCCYSIYFDSSKIVWHQHYYRKFLMTVLGFAGVLFRLQKRVDIDKMDHRLFRRKYLLVC